MSNDTALVQQTLRGNQYTFGELVKRYQKKLYQVAYTILKNSQIAEDIVQDALVQAYLKLITLNDPKDFYPWIKKITTNMALNEFHRNKKTVNLPDSDFDGINISEIKVFSHNPEKTTLEEELVKQVQEAVNELPEKFRIILVLREIEDLSYEEIADVTGLPTGTIRSRLHYARTALKQKILSKGICNKT